MSHDPAFVSALIRRDFLLFLRFAFAELGGASSYQHNWHIDSIVHQLMRCRDGDLRNLIVALPPRHLKSIIVSIAWVAWMLGNNPRLKFIGASYGLDLSLDFAFKCIRLMDSEWFRRAFPECRLDRRVLSDFTTTRGGGRLSTSIGGTLTGKGADYIIIDDPMKADDTHSVAEHEKVFRWFEETLSQRTAGDENACFILVMQRLHQGDLAGRLLEKGGWHYLKLPAIAQEDEKVPVGPHQFYQRRAGHALFPARQSLQYLRKKQAENPIVFAAQNLQDPVPLTGNWVDPEWFLYYDELPRGGKVVMSMDTASKPGATNDYTVAIVARFFNGRFYLIDVHRERMEFARLWGIVPQLCRRYGVQELLIEDASSGEMLIQRLRHEPPQGVPLPLAITPRGDKATRFEAEVSRIRAGEVLLPRNAIWVPEFIKEIAAFPNGRYDDQADALAQLLNNTWRAKKRRPNVGPILVHEGMTDDEFRRAVRAQDDASFLREAPSPRYPDDDDPWLPPFR